MKPVWIDFKRPTAPRLLTLRFVLLGFGACLLAYILIDQHRLSAERSALTWQQQDLTRLTSHYRPLATAIKTVANNDKPANEVLRQLNQPWDTLFSALEQAVGPNIHVLAVSPDAHKAAVTLKASATNASAALDFIERLQASPTLSNVHLVNQEIMVEAKHQPLLFTVNADWRTRP